MNPEQILEIINLASKYGPRIVGLVMKIKDGHGGEQTIDLLEDAGTKFDANIAQAKAALGE